MYDNDGLHVLSSAGSTTKRTGISRGAKAAIIEPDEQTEKYLKENQRYYKFDKKSLWSDEDAVYEKIMNFDISDLIPQIAEPPDIDRVKDVQEVEKRK